MKTTITTDHKWKPFVYRYDVPESVLADQFDYQDPNETIDGFFCYRGTWYHLDQFMRVGYPGPFGQTDENGYHGFAGDSYFSGVAIKLSEDC